MIRATVIDKNETHIRVRLAVGPDGGTLATAGILTFRREEWEREVEPTFRRVGIMAGTR